MHNDFEDHIRRDDQDGLAEHMGGVERCRLHVRHTGEDGIPGLFWYGCNID